MRSKYFRLPTFILLIILVALIAKSAWGNIKEKINIDTPSGNSSSSTPATKFDNGGLGKLFDSSSDKLDETAQKIDSIVVPGDSTEGLPELRIDFVDVGQADFIVVECGGEYATIDGGNVADSQLVYSYLDKRGIENIKYVFITHAHEDHCGGVSAILEHSKVEQIYCSVDDFTTKAFGNVVKKAAEQGKSIVVPSAGDTFDLGGAKFTLLGPLKNYSDPNNLSLVLRLDHGATSYLFTGDMETTAEKDLLEAGYPASETGESQVPCVQTSTGAYFGSYCVSEPGGQILCVSLLYRC